MQKYLLTLMFVVSAIVFLPAMARAQWTQTPYETYRMNDLIRRTPKKKAARRAIRNTPKHQSNTAQKVVRRKTRRVSKK